MGSSPREVTLKFSGPLAEDGQVPLRVLARSFDSLQRTLFNIGAALTRGGQRGSWKAEITETCELTFGSAKKGSLFVIAALPPERATVVPLGGDLGTQAVAKLSDTLGALGEGNSSRLMATFPDSDMRRRVLRAMVGLFPEEGADYELAVGALNASLNCSPKARVFLDAAARLEPGLDQDSIQTLTGTLYRIEVETGDRHVGIFLRRRQIRCFYSADQEDSIRELIPGSLVEVEGRVSLDAQGQVERVEEVIDIRTVQVAPLRIKRILAGDRLFHLASPIEVDVRFEDGAWTHDYAPLHLFSCDTSRGGSLMAFKEQFTFAYDQYANAPDSELTLDAVALKQALAKLVSRVEAS